MAEMIALEAQVKSVTTQHRVPLIVNGAHGEPVALHAVMGFQKGSLSNKLNTEENNVIFFK